MTDAMHRYPYFVRARRVLPAVALVLAMTPTHTGAVPAEHDPIGEGEDDIPIPERRDAGVAGPPEVIEGEILVARPLVWERAARLRVAFADDYAQATLTSVLENRGTYATPLAVRFRVPNGVVIGASCGLRCTATAAMSDGLVVVRTSPELPPGESREVTLVHATLSERVAGNVRVTYPARGSDTRTGRFRVLATGVPGVTMNGALVGTDGVEVSPFAATRLVAHPDGTTRATTLTHTVNGTRVVVRAPTRPIAPQRIAILIDGSPSTEGPARDAAVRALPALIGRLPRDSEIRVVLFGAQPEQMLAPTMASDVVPAALVASLGDARGTTTRLDRALASIEDARIDRVLVLGDGGLAHLRDDATAAMLRRHPVTYVVLGARAPSAALIAHEAQGRVDVVDARREGRVALEEHDEGPLVDRLVAALIARATVVVRDGRRVVTTARLGDGESLVLDTSAAHPTLSIGGRRVRPELRVDDVLARLPLPLRTIAVETRPRGRDLPRETILEALRRQFIPPARLCLRADRRGRAQHAIRAELVVRLAYREVIAIDVNGELSPQLRSCLADALEVLVLPAASAPMLVRYPIHTLMEDVPPVVELDEETRTDLERAMGDEADAR